VAIEVHDTGPGIRPEMLERLFRPFQRGTDRPGGFGLGLATVKRLAEAHGGSVAVASEVGRGSVFTVRLPAVAVVRS
jgi:signal transduction histidine kinase